MMNFNEFNSRLIEFFVVYGYDIEFICYLFSCMGHFFVQS